MVATKPNLFPIRWLAVAVGLTVSMFFWLGWHVYNSYRVGEMVKDEYVRGEELRDTLIRVHERLGTVVRMAVATGERSWRQRYQDLEDELQRAFEESIRLVSPGSSAALLMKAREDHYSHRELNQKALALSRDGRRQAALDLLASATYQLHENMLGEAAERFVTDLRERIGTTLLAERNKELLSVAVAFAIFAVSLTVWLFLVRRLQIWRADLLREIAARKEAEAQLRQAQKLEAVGHLASGIAHDFNNLLTAISGYVALAKKTLRPDHPAVSSLESVEQVAEQAEGVTRALLTFSRKTAARKQPVELAAVVEKAAHLLKRILPAGIDLIVDTGFVSGVWVNADSVQLQQVLLNLAINARDAMPNGGRLQIRLALPRDGGIEPQAVRLIVRDTGTGMSPETLARIFEPFFTTKPRGTGTGLGLAIVHGIVTDHGGTIEVESQVGRGTTFTVALPVARAQVRPSEPVEDREPCASHGEVVLVAEDHPYVRQIMTTGLRAAGYEVGQAEDGRDCSISIGPGANPSVCSSLTWTCRAAAASIVCWSCARRVSRCPQS